MSSCWKRISLPDPLARSIMPARSVLYEMGRITVYYRVDCDNRLLMGGRSVQRDVSAPDELRYLIDYAIRLWPTLRDMKWRHAWSGQLAITPDQYPHLHEPDDGVLVCLGFNGRGVALSTAMGPQIARRVIGGRSAEIDMPVTTMREIPFHALWRSAISARMIYSRVRDWIGL